MGSLKKAVKKVAKPEIIIPLALMAATGGMGAGLGGLKTAALGKAGAAGTAASGSLIPISRAAALSQGVATPGFLGFGGKLALGKGTLAKGIMAGLKNPLSAKGLATYGGGLGALSLMMGKDKTEAQKNLNTDPQAVYDMGRLMNKQMGGAYTDEELNTYMAPLLSQYGGKYQIADPAPERKRRMMFPGLNYSGLTRYAADGGAIVGDDELSQQLYDEMQREQEIEEALFRLKMGQSMSDEPIIMGPETYNTGRANGGRIGYSKGKLVGKGLGALINAIKEAAEAAADKAARAKSPIGRKGFSSGRPGRGYDMSDDVLKEVDEIPGEQEDIIRQMIELGEMDSFAYGGSVPQTNNIPQGMQIDGRGGGFIPMGAKEKHDDVPAMLAKNEFVMTSDAVKAAGGGSVNKGAQAMYDLMHSLESKV